MDIICVDFDGVVNSYRSGFTRDQDIPDEPMPGAADAIMRLRRTYKVVIFTTRARTVEGRNAVIAWLAKYGIEVDGITHYKIPAKIYLDDRGLKFEGDWVQAMQEIEHYATWQDIDELTRQQMKPKEDVETEPFFKL